MMKSYVCYVLSWWDELLQLAFLGLVSISLPKFGRQALENTGLENNQPVRRFFGVFLLLGTVCVSPEPCWKALGGSQVVSNSALIPAGISLGQRRGDKAAEPPCPGQNYISRRAAERGTAGPGRPRRLGIREVPEVPEVRERGAAPARPRR